MYKRQVQAATSVVAQQAPRAARRAVADAVIFNEAIDLPRLESEVRALWHLWQPQPDPQTGEGRQAL